MESAEHWWIGEQISLEFEDGRVKAAGLKLKIRLGGTLDAIPTITYGQGIALGGDFYGVVGQPISTAKDPESVFRDGWLQLAIPVVPHERDRILLYMQQEIDEVMAAYKAGKSVSALYDKIGDKYSRFWAIETALRYVTLAVKNFDHFGANAVKAYRVGHKIALDEAMIAAKEPKDSPMRRVRLERAYAMNAFADHFLTDLFSAGHLRVPREELYAKIPIEILSGSLTRTMHNEDSRHGLNVRGVKSNPWLLYGDKMLLEPVSDGNRERVTYATQLSADEVWSAFQGNTVSDYKALEQIPDLEYLRKYPNGNFSPLFKLNNPADALPLRRKNIGDRRDVDYVNGWSPLGTWWELRQKEHTDYRHVRCYDLESKKFLGWLTADGGNYVSIVPDEAGVHGVRWNFDGDKWYVEKDTDGGPRYLGLSEYGRAGWGLKSGWRNPVVLNADMTLSLADDPKRLLCVDRLAGGKWGGGWSDGTSTRFVIQVDLPVPVPTMAS